MKDIFDEIQKDMDEFFQEIDKAIGRDPEEVDVITDHLPDPMTDEEVEYLEMKAELHNGIQGIDKKILSLNKTTGPQNQLSGWVFKLYSFSHPL